MISEFMHKLEKVMEREYLKKKKDETGSSLALFGLVWNTLALAVLSLFFPPHFLPLTPRRNKDLTGTYLVFGLKHNFKKPYTQTHGIKEPLLCCLSFFPFVFKSQEQNIKRFR